MGGHARCHFQERTGVLEVVMTAVVSDFFARKMKILILALLTYAALC